MTSYATVDEYRIDSGDNSTPDDRVSALLSQLSAKLRASARISEDYPLNDDQRMLARMLVTDAARKGLVTPSIDGISDPSGITQTSFTANGFQSSYTLSNPSGAAYFDNSTLKAFMRSLRKSQSIGNMFPYYGG